VVRDAPGPGCPFIRDREGRRATIMAGIEGEMGGGVNGDLSSLNL
jgi:hypothetical protein